MAMLVDKGIQRVSIGFKIGCAGEQARDLLFDNGCFDQGMRGMYAGVQDSNSYCTIVILAIFVDNWVNYRLKVPKPVIRPFRSMWSQQEPEVKQVYLLSSTPCNFESNEAVMSQRTAARVIANHDDCRTKMSHLRRKSVALLVWGSLRTS
jgi:hypothetical protein